MRIPGYVLMAILLSTALLIFIIVTEPRCPIPSVPFLGRALVWSCIVVMEPSR